MRSRSWLPFAVLLVLVAASVAGLALTRPPPPPEPVGERAEAGGGGQAGAKAGAKGATEARPTGRRRRERVVDLQPLLTARALAPLARTPEEQDLARQALRLGDHAVDLAFADAIRRLAEEPPAQTPELSALAEARERARTALAAATRELDELTARAEAARDAERERLEDQRELARARQALAQDELDEAQERLAQAGGDPQARIQRLRAAYEAGQKEPAAAASAQPGAAGAPAAAPAPAVGGSLLARARAWTAERQRLEQLDAGRAETLDRVKRLEDRAGRLRKRAEASDAEAKRLAGGPAVPAAGDAAGDVKAADGKAAAVAALKGAARDRQRVTELGKRLDDLKELAEVYGDWGALVAVQVRAALHRLLAGVLWVLLAVAAVLAAGALVERAIRGREQEELRKGTLRTVARFGVELVGLAVVLLMAFGAPGQATTILGLAGAGLTVAMKDFIVAFFGWFILMGRNGIRVGDWVEVKGVGGEVAEIGLFHTVLLETGSWTDAGHPTGRRVSFVNSFAIEGHYFNFSTSGQWMWDELRVLVPTGQDPYPVIDGVQRLVERETEVNARQAEQEWRGTTSRYRVRTFSAVPGINVVPTASGIELEVRYITRAYERHETRRRLYQSVVELMHGPRPEAAAGARPQG